MYFTIEEENLICIFDVSSRTAFINEISAALHEFIEPELCDIADNILKKLNDMSDEEFDTLIFTPEYYDEEMEE